MKSEASFGEMLEQYLPQSFKDSDTQFTATYAFHKFDVEVNDSLCRIKQRKKFDCCTDRHGEAKKAYSTKNEAYESADYIYSEREVNLEVYKCRNGYGWHLTETLQK
jgi:hypothetical protein